MVFGRRLAAAVVHVVVVVLAVSAAPPTASALIINSADGGLNNVPPDDDPGWYGVGRAGLPAAIYLGDGWILTAAHFTAVKTEFNGINYTPVANSAVRLRNPLESGKSEFTDVRLHRIVERPDLPRPRIAQAPPPVGAEVTIIGIHHARSPEVIHWDEDWNVVEGPGHYSGYSAAAMVDGMLWGENRIATAPDWYTEETFFGPTDIRSFTTNFDADDGLPFEAQAGWGDSGAAVYYRGGPGEPWVLAGIALDIPLFPGQSILDSVFGNATVIADLSYYRSQILALNPIPGDVNLDAYVDIFDVAQVSSHWATDVAAGDANGDGTVDIFDVALISANWEPSIGPVAAHVPEPMAGCLLILGLTGGLAGRRFFVRIAIGRKGY